MMKALNFTVKMHLNPQSSVLTTTTDHTQVILGTAVTFMFV